MRIAAAARPAPLAPGAACTPMGTLLARTQMRAHPDRRWLGPGAVKAKRGLSSRIQKPLTPRAEPWGCGQVRRTLLGRSGRKECARSRKGFAVARVCVYARAVRSGSLVCAAPLLEPAHQRRAWHNLLTCPSCRRRRAARAGPQERDAQDVCDALGARKWAPAATTARPPRHRPNAAIWTAHLRNLCGPPQQALAGPLLAPLVFCVWTRFGKVCR